MKICGTVFAQVVENIAGRLRDGCGTVRDGVSLSHYFPLRDGWPILRKGAGSCVPSPTDYTGRRLLARRARLWTKGFA